MSKLQDAYEAIADRLKSDSDFQDYFNAMDTVPTTKKISKPYFAIHPPALTTEPILIPTTESLQMSIPFEFVVSNSDTNKLAYEYLKAVEIILNAYYGSDPCYSSKILRTTFSFDPPDVLENNDIVGLGVITANLQVFSQGTL